MFRPVPVVKMNLYVLDEHVPSVTWTLAQLGLVHLIDVTRIGRPGETHDDLDALERAHQSIADRSRRLLEHLELEYDPAPPNRPIVPEANIETLEASLGALEHTLPSLQDDVALLPSLASASSSRRGCRIWRHVSPIASTFSSSWARAALPRRSPSSPFRRSATRWKAR